jgi:NTP pyrophosphatase (non-canonical NTP hydrolase)
MEVDGWIVTHGRYWAPLSQLARLTEEVGELAREVNLTYGEKPRAIKDRDGSLAAELGDVLFIVIALANSLGIDLQKTLRLTLAKYQARVPPGRAARARRSPAAGGRRRSVASEPRKQPPRHPSAPD